MKNHGSHQGQNPRNVHKKNNITGERRQVNFVKPFIYYFLEILLLLPVCGVFELDFNPLKWSGYSYTIAAIWILYITKHLVRVLARQKIQEAKRYQKPMHRSR